MGAEVVVDARFAAVAAIADDAMFAADGDGRVTSWSAGCERLFGRAADGVVGAGLETLFPPRRREEIRTVVARARTGEPVRHVDTEILRPDGLALPASLSLGSVDGAGARTSEGMVVVVRDLTEQQLAQAMLAEVERRLEEGEALTHVGSWLWDVRTDVVQWSSELHRIHGVDPADFGGTLESHLQPVVAADRDRVAAAMGGAVRAAEPLALEYRITRPDGAGRLLRVRAQPAFGSDGEVVGLRGVGEDATDRPA